MVIFYEPYRIPDLQIFFIKIIIYYKALSDKKG